MLDFDVNTSIMRFGSLELTGISSDGKYELRALGADAGTNPTVAPEVRVAEMVAALQDGALAITTGHDNVVLPVAVQVLDGPLADPGEGVPLGLAALVGQCRATWDERIVPFRWVPAANFGPPCVFKVTAATLAEADWDDYKELFPDTRGSLILLQLTCAPFAFADNSVTETIAAPTSSSPVTPTVTSIDTCGSTTNWAGGTSSGVSTTVTGSDAGDTYVMGQVPGSSYAHSQWITRSSLSQNMAATPYLMVKAASYATNGATAVLSYSINGTPVTPIASSGTTVWLPFSGTLNSVQVTAAFAFAPLAGTNGVKVYDLSRTDMVAPGTLTQLEVARQFTIQGSVRTPASIAVSGVKPSDQSSVALGQVIAYSTRAQGVAMPPLRPTRVDGGADSTDTTAYSGKKSALSTTHRFQIPVSAIASAGYGLPVRVQASSTGAKTLTWTAKTVVAGTTVSDVQTGTVTINIAAANTWQMAQAGIIALPAGLAGSAGVVEISLASSTLTLDNGWLCDLDHGQLSIVDCGANTRMWLDGPTFDMPVPTIWVGKAADRSDAYMPGASIVAMGSHEVVGGEVVNIFVGSGNPAAISLTYTPAGLIRAPKVA